MVSLRRRGSSTAAAAVLVAVLQAGCGGGLVATTPDGSSQPSSPTPSRPVVADEVRAFEADTSYAEVPLPTSIAIPSLDVSSSLAELGLNPDGTVEVPARFEQAGWYAFGARPGQKGSAVVLGHVDSRAGPAVFAEVHTLAKDATIEIGRADGSTLTFAVERIEQHAKTRFPTEDVYYPTLEPGLRLVTCGGDFDPNSGHYEDNVIVYARLLAD